MEEIISKLRTNIKNGLTRSLAYRRQQLDNITKLLNENESLIAEALYKDFRKSAFDVFTTEIAYTLREINFVKKHLKKWSSKKSVSLSLLTKPAKGFIYSEPYGVVLIISPWNYPIQLSFLPMIGAIAAGNAVILKPSEISTHTSQILNRLINKYLDDRIVKVIEGDAEKAKALLKHKLDYIFFTGSPSIGRKIMQAAAKHLTPITLELGGKNPCIVDDNVNLKVVARRIAYGKFTNAGQICLAPDYILVHKDNEIALIEELKNAINQFYGENPKLSEEYPRIINDEHFQRLQKLLSEGEIVIGGQSDPTDRYIAPTIIRQVSLDSPIMQNEIFGPILPIIPIESINDASQFINNRDKPLALYLFSNDKANKDKLIEQTSSGGITINHVIFHAADLHLPFGGVGQSGIGRYHGKYTFDTFSHMKAVLDKSLHFDNKLIYPNQSRILKSLFRPLSKIIFKS